MLNRKKWSIVLVAVFVLGGVGLVNHLSAQTGTAAAKPSIVAVVDIEKVLEKLDERKAVNAKLQSDLDELRAWQQAQRKKLTNLQMDMKLLDPTGSDYRAMNDQLRKESITFEAESKFRSSQLEMEQALQLEILYRKITSMIATLAKQNGYDLVLFKDNLPRVQGVTTQQLVALIKMRKVLYASDQMDVTGQVTQRMNNAYNNSAGGSGGGNG